MDSIAVARGQVTVEVIDSEGNLKYTETVKNLITAVGDQFYAGRAALASGLPGAVTGMKLGTGSTAVAKTGSGAALTTYLAGSNKALDGGYPSAAGGVATYRRTYAPGEATTASPITEVALVTDSIATDATSTAANTISRALLTGIPSKNAGDTLIVTWTHTILGS